MTPPSPERGRHASSPRPVNLRTAARNGHNGHNGHKGHRGAAQTPPSPLLRQVLAQRQARQLLGRPLRAQLSAPGLGTDQARRLSQGLLLAGCALAAWAGVGFWQGSALPWALGPALAALGLLGAAAWWGRRARQGSSLGAFDPAALGALDRLLGLLGPELPPASLTLLGEIKALLVRMGPWMADTPDGDRFTSHDRLYVIELVRRYLPDSLSAFLQVPRGQRMRAETGQASALTLLNEQLALLHAELLRRERHLVQARQAALEQQQRFLQAKHGSAGQP